MAGSAEVPPDTALEASISEAIMQHVPHNRALGVRFVRAERGRVTLALPYDERFAGNPLTRVLHGGAITALLDATCGIAVFLKLAEPLPVATLDLRIDYLRPATPDKEIHARAECFRITPQVAFVRCEAFHPDEERDGTLVAVANGTFIISRGAASEPKERPR
jgi:uncharacterized protein (TIGR00369 family)